MELESTISVANALSSIHATVDRYTYIGMCAAFFTPLAIKMILTARLLYKSATFLQLCFGRNICTTGTGNRNFANQFYEITV